jgi:hypothetical protein
MNLLSKRRIASIVSVVVFAASFAAATFAQTAQTQRPTTAQQQRPAIQERPNPTITQQRVPETVIPPCGKFDSVPLLSAAGPAGSSVILSNIKAGPSGCQGTLTITLAGQQLPPVVGTIQKDGSVALGSDVIVPDILGSGVDLILQQGGRIASESSTAAQFSGFARMKLPYFSASGEQAEVQLDKTSGNRGTGSISVSPIGFQMTSDGGFSIAASAQLTKPARTTPQDWVHGLKMAGFTIIPHSMSITLNHSATGGKPFAFAVVAAASIRTFIPYLPTQDNAPIPLEAAQLTLNEDGIVKLDASIGSAAVQAGKQDGVGPASFYFAQPMGFAMNLLSADVSYSNNKFTKFVMYGSLILPSCLPVPGLPGPWFSGVGLTLSGQTWVATPGGAAKIWFGTDPSSPYTLTVDQYSVDLSPNGGVKVEQGRLSGKDFKDVPVGKGDLSIDTFGVSGAVALPTQSEKVSTIVGGGFTVTANHPPGSKVIFKQNARTGGAEDLPGSVILKDNSKDYGTLPVRVNVPADGPLVVTIDPTQPSSINLGAGYGGLGITVSAVSLQPAGDGNYTLSLTGTLGSTTAGDFLKDIPGASGAGMALPFTDVGLGANKGFIAGSSDGMINLDNPEDVELGLFSLGVSQFRLPTSDADGIKLTGAVKLSGDLPISGEMDFDGLTISSGGGLTFGALNIPPEHPLSIMDVATISGSLTRQTITVGQDPVPKSYLAGKNITVTLNALGDMKSNFQFLVGNGTWLILGGLDLGYQPGSGIPLGESDFALYGFHGGLGHNVALINASDPSFDPSNLSYYQPTSDGGWLFQAGVKVGTNDAFLLWGDAIMTVTTKPLVINLNVQGNLLETMGPKGSGDRTATVNVTYDNDAGTFRATGEADLTFPDRQHSFATAKGSADLLLEKGKSHFWFGWPPPATNSINVLGVGESGGFGLGPGKTFGVYFKQGGSWGPLSGEIDGMLNADVNNGFNVSGTLHASGGVDFLVFSASAEASLTAAMTISPKPPPVTLRLDGEFEGCIGILWGHICASVGAGITLP